MGRGGGGIFDLMFKNIVFIFFKIFTFQLVLTSRKIGITDLKLVLFTFIFPIYHLLL